MLARVSDRLVYAAVPQNNGSILARVSDRLVFAAPESIGCVALSRDRFVAVPQNNGAILAPVRCCSAESQPVSVNYQVWG